MADQESNSNNVHPEVIFDEKYPPHVVIQELKRVGADRVLTERRILGHQASISMSTFPPLGDGFDCTMQLLVPSVSALVAQLGAILMATGVEWDTCDFYLQTDCSFQQQEYEFDVHWVTRTVVVDKPFGEEEFEAITKQIRLPVLVSRQSSSGYVPFAD